MYLNKIYTFMLKYCGSSERKRSNNANRVLSSGLGPTNGLRYRNIL